MVPSPPNALVFENVDTIGGSIQIAKNGNPTPDKVIMYSTDGENWNEYEDNQVIATAPGGKVYFKSDDDYPFSDDRFDYRQFVISGKTKAYGSVEHIGPMGDRCYMFMFTGCSSLISAPELPATSLATQCYLSMFEGCTSLKSAPKLPATTLATDCYNCMFASCTSLESAPELPATSLANACYNGMFEGCTSLKSAPILPATSLEDNCYSNMFNGCSSLTSAPELPATSLTVRCYNGMFVGCTSLESAPELPATTILEGSYAGMFDGCQKIAEIKCNASMLGTGISSSWLSNVSPTGTFYKNPSYTPSERTVNTIPSGWTVVDWV